MRLTESGTRYLADVRRILGDIEQGLLDLDADAVHEDIEGAELLEAIVRFAKAYDPQLFRLANA